MLNLASLISTVVLSLPLTAVAAPAVPVIGTRLEDRAVSQTYKVAVGKGGKPRYNPQYVHAKVGDTIRFEFFPREHSVTETSFDNPCHEINGGYDTGLITFSKYRNMTRTYKVTKQQPQFFYSSAHYACVAGMVFAVNPPRTGRTFQKFQNNAIHSVE
ncbi:hypothetical protein BDV93DRAFT_560330 [Ceratobasidium sp. AG-I]|nr:hypothetical protein BDV93DRAFT_560330 [Ceratobasidium sp. AG-I]